MRYVDLRWEPDSQDGTRFRLRGSMHLTDGSGAYMHSPRLATVQYLGRHRPISTGAMRWVINDAPMVLELENPGEFETLEAAQAYVVALLRLR